MKKNILVIDGGGRGYAIAWKLAQSPRVGKIFVAPGNGGTSQIAENIAINTTDIDGLVRFAKEHRIYLTVVGPDDPLALGIVDAFRAKNLRIFGPPRAAAEIESSKAFAKELMVEAGIPTASFRVFRKYNEALAYVREHGSPIVVKASGLAFGKGVYVCKTLAQAEIALKEIMLNRVHKSAGNEVVIEEFLDGQEVSIHALCHGENYVLFPPTQDHKPLYDGDVGKNTGGMGAIGPVPWVNAGMLKTLGEQIVRPTLETLAKRGRPFTGLLYPGLKMASDGPRVVEFNGRPGDPETQIYMRLLKTDLFDILEACINGTLNELTIEWYPIFAACIVIASGGYPDKYRRGLPIHGITEAEHVPSVIVFHAGTIFDGELKTSGGRVLGVTATGNTLRDALNRAYEATQLIQFEDMHYRRDIGAEALKTAF